ncbi:MAG TPA: hypothetical protein VN867_14050, partial [Candidatus Binataceae bacterium]|nr:hypothetical protein [Candidatus Binataceae bacterium]
MTARRTIAKFFLSAAFLCITAGQPRAATDLQLAPDLSFTDDSSSNFPIAGKALGDATVAQDRATILFFGTAHCWN